MATQVFATFTQDPGDRLDYLINWKGGDKPFLLDADVLTASSWTAYTDKWVETDALVIDENSMTDTTTIGWVSFVDATSAGKTYYATCHADAASGRKKDLSIKILCKEQ